MKEDFTYMYVNTYIQDQEVALLPPSHKKGYPKMCSYYLQRHFNVLYPNDNVCKDSRRNTKKISRQSAERKLEELSQKRYNKVMKHFLRPSIYKTPLTNQREQNYGSAYNKVNWWGHLNRIKSIRPIKVQEAQICIHKKEKGKIIKVLDKTIGEVLQKQVSGTNENHCKEIKRNGTSLCINKRFSFIVIIHTCIHIQQLCQPTVLKILALFHRKFVYQHLDMKYRFKNL